MSVLATLFALLPSLLIPSLAWSKEPISHAQKIAGLIDPAKLATLGERGANPRVHKYVAQLYDAQQAGRDPKVTAAEAVKLAGMMGEAAQLTVEAMVRNLTIAEQLGCLTPAGLSEMRRGRAPTVTLGHYAGDELSVDHIIPLAVLPQLSNVIANLELMPLRMNRTKSDKLSDRGRALALRLRSAGLL